MLKYIKRLIYSPIITFTDGRIKESLAFSIVDVDYMIQQGSTIKFHMKTGEFLRTNYVSEEVALTSYVVVKKFFEIYH